MSVATISPAPIAAPDTSAAQRTALIAGVAGLVAFAIIAAIRFGIDSSLDLENQPRLPNSTPLVQQIFQSYSVGFIFWFSLPMGSMVLLMIQYLVFSKWGILTRRILEASSRTLPLIAGLSVPVAVSFFLTNLSLPDGSPYWWARPLEPQAGIFDDAEKKRIREVIDREAERKGPELTSLAEGELTKAITLKELQEKHNRYLNPVRALIAGVVYFSIWFAMMFTFNALSRKAELEPNSDARPLLSKLAGPGLILYALTITFAATDWVISLEPTWASTMFPVIFAVNQILTSYVFTVAVMLLFFRDTLAKKIPAGYQIHLGSFMLALTLFWTYTSFSQFLLVWVANLPEEIPFFLKRSGGGWEWVSAALAIFHFAVPFLLLLYRDVKSHPRLLPAIAIMLMLICFVDVLWWIEPHSGHVGQPLFWLMDVAAFVGIGGLWFWFFLFQISGKPLLPTAEAAALDDHHGDHAVHHGEHHPVHQGATP